MTLTICPSSAQQPQSPQQQPPEPQKIEPVRSSVTVVEKISAETPANVTVMDSTEIQATPGTDLDDRLRDIPGFSLFKRSSSMVANPTTQGVSLRGIGSSGASRTLVLWDGVPANDPFGGWVYWTQFIPDEMDRVEVSRGAATSIFGNLAMSGAIASFTRQPERLHFLLDYEYGNEDTHDLSAGFSHLWRGWAFSGTSRAYTTDGYYIVPENIRGTADRKAGVRFVTGDAHLDRFTPFGNFFFRVNLLVEDRQNGTVLTHNSTSMGTAALHYVKELANDSISILGYHTREGFHSSFSSVTGGRNVERITYLQSVPNNAVGGAALWQHHKLKWDLIGGADLERVEGVDTDSLVPTGFRIGGGVQVARGVFGQIDGTAGPLRLFAGGRESLVGHSNFFSPSAGVVYGKKWLRLRGSVYRAFRAPTLNELYRNFSVGNTFTEANAGLLPETVFGGEVGADWIGESSNLRFTAYRNSLGDLITNVTLSSSASSIVRQRANAASAISRGLEASYEKRFGDFSGELQYLFVDSRYVTGFRVAQIPKHQGTATLTYHHGGTLAYAGFRSYSYQFDDDLNQFRLPGYATLQFLARQRIAKSLSGEFSLENALDRIFYTAFTPTPNIGQPRLWRIGLRWH